MRVSLNWLKDFLELKMDINKIQDGLTMAGLEVGGVVDIEGDKVMEIEITPNRPDCLSILGIARELGAVLKKPLKMPLSIRKNYAKKLQGDSGKIIEILDKKGCRRYIGAIIKNVKIQSSPKWLVDRLNAVGIRTINNVVDITNYVLFELGQPLHAFDLDRLVDKKIIVRRAKKGESIVTIDGVKRELDTDVLVIADAVRPVAIAGIMGGRDTEITETTKNILLESAYFDPLIIRKAQRKIGIVTESSYRFERDVDFNMVLPASIRAQELIKEIAGGKLYGGLFDKGERPEKDREIVFLFDEIERVLGVKIDISSTIDYLKRLHLKPVRKSDNKIYIKVPSYRQDLRSGIDIVEEVARLYGYARIPTKRPLFTVQRDYQEEKRDYAPLRKALRRTLFSLGMSEIVTYTLISRTALEKFGFPIENTLRLVNPLSLNQEYMRPSLLPEMVETLGWNLNRGNTSLCFFEEGKVYLKEGTGVNEQHRLGLGVCGTKEGNWKERPRELDFFDLKGIIVSLLDYLGVEDYVIEKSDSSIFRSEFAASLRKGDDIFGSFGEVRPDILKTFDIKERVYLGEIDLEVLGKYVELKKNITPLPKYPSIKRDISLVVDLSISVADIYKVIEDSGGALVKSITLFDLYKGQQIQEGKKSLAYRIEYRSDDKTLKDEEVLEIHKNIQEALVKKLNAQIR